MQAKVIATGEIVEVIKSSYDHKLNEAIYTDSNNIHNIYYQYELEFIPSVNWEQRRFELVKSIFPQIASFVKEAILRGDEIGDKKGKTTMQVVAEISINYADAVIEKLKEK